MFNDPTIFVVLFTWLHTRATMPRLYPTKYGNLTIEEYYQHFGDTIEERADYWTFGDNFHVDTRRAGWYVFESQTRNPLILLRTTTDNCTCPFKRITHKTCKHILAVQQHEDPTQESSSVLSEDSDDAGSLADFIVEDSGESDAEQDTSDPESGSDSEDADPNYGRTIPRRSTRNRRQPYRYGHAPPTVTPQTRTRRAPVRYTPS